MAWQEPKTNWLPPDGVRDSDFNRIEGNILELYSRQNASVVSTAKVIYVAGTGSDLGGGSNGSDTTGNGTAAAPYATVTKALSTLPKNLNAQPVVISIAAGTYSENVVVAGFTSPITFELTGIARFTSLRVNGCVLETTGQQMNVVPASSANGVVVTNGGLLIARNLVYIGAGINCLTVENGSQFAAYTTVTLSNATARAIEVATGSQAYIAILAGTSNATGIAALAGGIIQYGSSSLSATTKTLTTGGGRIYTGAQSSIPNY